MKRQRLMTQHNLMDHLKIVIENTLSGGALVETQQNSFEDTNDAGGVSSSRQQLPSARKWTKDHTPELIIGISRSMCANKKCNLY